MNVYNVFDDIFVIENFLDIDVQNNILRNIQGDRDFPWFLIHRISMPEEYPYGTSLDYKNENITDDVGFFHLAHNGQAKYHTFNMFEPILINYSKIFSKVITKIIRVRIRYTSKSSNHSNSKYAIPHVDDLAKEKFKTIIYYIDDSDGDTIFFDKIYDYQKDFNYNPIRDKDLKEVFRFTPKKGSAIVFDGHRYHAGNFPINYSSRIIANFDFLEKNLNGSRYQLKSSSIGN